MNVEAKYGFNQGQNGSTDDLGPPRQNTNGPQGLYGPGNLI